MKFPIKRKKEKKKKTSKWVKKFRIFFYSQWGLRCKKIIKKSFTFFSHLIMEKKGLGLKVLGLNKRFES
jgi:hypothetical protein